MADHALPVLTSTYTNFVSELDARFDDLAVGLDPAVTTATNVPVNTIRWSSASNTWQKWSGSAWNQWTTTLSINTLSVTGNTTLGDASTDTVQVNGYMGVGGAATSNVGLYLTSSSLASASQYGVFLTPTSTSAATTTTTTLYTKASTAAAAYTSAAVRTIHIADATKGAGSTITDQQGLYIADQTQGTNNYGITSLVSSGTNKWNIYASGSAANYFAGQVLVGTTASTTISSVAAQFQIRGATAAASWASLSRNSADANSASVIFGKERAGAAVVPGDVTGSVQFAGYDATNYLTSASVVAAVDGTVSTGIVPGRLVFNTASSAGALTERLRIDSAGNVGIGSAYSQTRLDVGAPVSAGAVADVAFFGQGHQGTVTTGQGARIYLGAQMFTPRAAAIEAAISNGLNGHHLAFLTNLPGASATEKVRIDANGFVFVGHTASVPVSTSINGQLQVSTTGTSALGQSWAHYENSTNGPVLALGKSRGATAGTFTTVASGDTVGQIRFAGADGTNLQSQVASVVAAVDAAVSTGIVPGRLVFNTTSTAGAITERMRIDSSGFVSLSSATPKIYQTTAADRLCLTGANDGVVSSGGTIFLRDDTAATNAGGIEFWTGTSVTGAERLRIDSAGNMGLGVTPSAWAASFRAIDISSASTFGASGADVSLFSNIYSNGTNWIYKTTNAASFYRQQAGAHQWYTVTPGTAAATATPVQAMLLDNRSNLAVTGAITAAGVTANAITQSIHSGAIVKAIIYDTSKDSDGGAWRKRTLHTSWYNETLGGTTWLGQAATAAAAWALAGAVTGAYFQNTTDGKFYTLGASSPTVAECFRGNAREFPQQVAIVAETGRVVIYDLTQTGCPMWMVFVAGAADTYLVGTHLVSAVAAINGKLLVPGSSANDGVIAIDFVADSGVQYRSAADTSRVVSKPISGRNAGGVWSVSTLLGNLVNSQVNDCAITVLDSAPIDPATGLPTPTIAVACGSAGAGGISVIRDDGTVASITATGYSTSTAIRFLPGNKIAFTLDGSTTTGRNVHVYAIPTTTISTGANGYQRGAALEWYSGDGTTTGSDLKLVGIQAAGGGNGTNLLAQDAIASSLYGLSKIKPNPGTPTKGMVAYVTKDYNSGWMNGDIRGAFLADTVAETITASGELVTNGTFTTDTSGWTAGNTGSLSAAGALLTVTNGAAQSGYAYQAVTVVVGETYVVQWTAATGTSQAYRRIGTSVDGIQYFSEFAANTTSQVSFTATTTTAYITLGVSTPTAGLNATFDNISVKLAEPDRSVKNNGLIVNGSLTKAAVASGAGLVAYSGFSATNYLEQPYNSQLDFGTGDFCVMGWVNTPSYPTNQGLLTRAVAGTAASLLGLIFTTSSVDVYCGAGSAAIAYATLPAANTWAFLAVQRLSGVLYLHVNGVQVASVANTNNITNTASLLNIGRWGYAGNLPTGGSMALWRISATAPSADQIAHIYRTELPLFQANAQCTIAGTSNAVTALAYDDVADLLHVGTSWGRTSFNGLLRVDSEATTTGALTSLSANQGSVLTSGTSGKYYQPAISLRDELRRKDEARAALGKVVIGQEFTATAGQTAFICRKGYDVRFVYSNGLLKRLTTDYTVSDDGFQKTVTFTSGQLLNVPVTIMLTRS